MLPQSNPDRIRVVFDDRRLVANAGLLLPATLAQHLGLRELVDHHLDLGGAPGRANTGDKMLTLVASALAGGDCIDDTDALRAGGTVGVLGCVVKAPSTLGIFRWGHVRHLDRVSRQLLARAWAAGDGPGDSPLTIACTRPSAKPAAIAADSGDVLSSRMREGRANTACGTAHFLSDTVGRVHYGAASGQLHGAGRHPALFIGIEPRPSRSHASHPLVSTPRPHRISGFGVRLGLSPLDIERKAQAMLA